MSQAIQKLKRRAREDGLISTTAAVYRHGKKTVDRALRGKPGYHRVRQAQLNRQYDLDAIEPRWVEPEAIEFLTGDYERREDGHLDYVPHFKPREANWDHLPFEAEVPYGTVRGGEWDLTREPFDSLLMYQGVEQRFSDGMDWENTIYFIELKERFIGQGWDDLVARNLAMGRCERIETLYSRVNARGYQSQAELNGHPLHEVTVAIARDGTLLYNCEGRNRLCVAKVLGVGEIPVLVLVRHREFENQLSTGEA